MTRRLSLYLNTPMGHRPGEFNAKTHDRKLVCLACQAIGCSPRDCKIYLCAGSESTDAHEAGHGERHKRNPTSIISLRCTDCTGCTTFQRGHKRPLHPDDDEKYDVQKLLRTLRHQSAWRCTCKNTQPAPKTRAKSALAGKAHDAKCMLQRVAYKEQRWDGKNVGVTLDQLQYLADQNLY